MAMKNVLSLATLVMDCLLNICGNINIILGIAYLLIYRCILRNLTVPVFMPSICNVITLKNLSVFYSSALHHIINIVNYCLYVN